MGRRTFSTPDEDDVVDVVIAFKTALCDVLPAVGATAKWEYDFGDGWEHSFQVVRNCDPPWESPITFATVVDGGGLCTAEDIGGRTNGHIGCGRSPTLMASWKCRATRGTSFWRSSSARAAP